MRSMRRVGKFRRIVLAYSYDQPTPSEHTSYVRVMLLFKKFFCYIKASEYSQMKYSLDASNFET